MFSLQELQDLEEGAGQVAQQANPLIEDQALAKHPAGWPEGVFRGGGKLAQLEMEDEAPGDVRPHLLGRTY